MVPGSSSCLAGALAQCALNSQNRLRAVFPLATPALLQTLKMCTQPLASQVTMPPSFTAPPHLLASSTPKFSSPFSDPQMPAHPHPLDPAGSHPAASAAAQSQGPSSSGSSRPGGAFPGSSGSSGREGGSGESGLGTGESTSSSSEAGAGAQAESPGASQSSARKYWEQLRAGLGGFTSHVKGFAPGGQAGGPPLADRASKLAKVVAKEIAEAVLPREEKLSATRVYQGKVAEPMEGSGPSEMVLVKRPKTSWEKLLGEWESKFGHHPLFQRLTGIKVGENPALKKGQEMVADLKERYENSDHPLVHKVEDMKERFFSQNEAALVVQEIRSRDPSFDMNKFIQSLRADAPRVVQALLTRNLETLALHCGPELQERFAGIFRNFDAMGAYDDPTILFTSDVELAEMHMVDEDPMVVVQFNCQQLRCTRDKFGNVIDGSADSIQRVYYFWGLQQERQGVVTADGQALPPRWVIKDMMWKSMQALV